MCDMHCIRNGLERTGGGNRGINSRINDIILRCSKFKYHYIIKKLIITTAITIIQRPLNSFINKFSVN